ncbi:MAG: hypothetical protein SOX36_03240 [Candidatus Cryptobacteroides sp.]|nr:hypothetical protein [Candidatus Cryptobacteroides sp.]
MARITKEARKTITNISAAISKFEQGRKALELSTSQRAWDEAGDTMEDAVLDLQELIFTLVGEVNMMANATDKKHIAEALRLTYERI